MGRTRRAVRERERAVFQGSDKALADRFHMAEIGAGRLSMQFSERTREGTDVGPKEDAPM